jgi:hypothetical protein
MALGKPYRLFPTTPTHSLPCSPYTCDVSTDATGQNFVAMKVITNVPGTNSRSNAKATDFPLVAQMPAYVPFLLYSYISLTVIGFIGARPALVDLTEMRASSAAETQRALDPLAGVCLSPTPRLPLPPLHPPLLHPPLLPLLLLLRPLLLLPHPPPPARSVSSSHPQNT